MPEEVQFVVTTSPQSPRPQSELPKRVSCDACRRRKVRCDRNQPCSRCTASFYDCTFSEPARKKRKTVTDEKIELLEGRIKSMEEASAQNAAAAPDMPSSTRSPSPMLRGLPQVRVAQPGAKVYHPSEKGDLEFTGRSADRAFMEGFKHQLGDWVLDTTHKRVPAVFAVPGLLDTSRGPPVDVELPPKHVARRVVDAALDAQILFGIMHRPSFDNMFTLVYSLDQSHYRAEEWRFLALLYAILAYGGLFVDSAEGQDYDVLSKSALYYEKSLQLQNIAECKDLVSLQAIFFKILYLLSTTRIFTCYTYVSAMLSVAIRMGLHRVGSPTAHQDLIQRETGKRVFWAVWTLTNEVAATCGLPVLLSNEEIDQESPIEVNDSYIEARQILQQPEGEVCFTSIAAIYQQLHHVFQKAGKHIYSENQSDLLQSGSMGGYPVSMSKLKEIEGQLHRWVRELPVQLVLGNAPDSPELTTARFTLCILYAHAQLYIYRPFLRQFMLHTVNLDQSESTNSKWLATVCIQACENIIVLCEDMYKRGLLRGGNWLITRALFSSTLTLFYVILTSRDTAPLQTQSICTRFALGRKISDSLAKRSGLAHRWKVIMTVMIATLPSSARHIQEELLSLENKVSELTLYQAESGISDDAYTASLGASVLNHLGSESSTADKIKWLAPHHREALGLGGDAHEELRCPPSSQALDFARDNIEGSTDIVQLDNNDIGDYFLASSAAGGGHGLAGMPLDTGEVGFGDLDEFLNLQNWL
ncbi:fungal-specific transcription factor domain-containing protein [Aspergillus heterothallicus]